MCYVQKGLEGGRDCRCNTAYGCAQGVAQILDLLIFRTAARLGFARRDRYTEVRVLADARQVRKAAASSWRCEAGGNTFFLGAVVELARQQQVTLLASDTLYVRRRLASWRDW